MRRGGVEWVRRGGVEWVRREGVEWVRGGVEWVVRLKRRDNEFIKANEDVPRKNDLEAYQA